jgi:hypothetical protein
MQYFRSSTVVCTITLGTPFCFLRNIPVVFLKYVVYNNMIDASAHFVAGGGPHGRNRLRFAVGSRQGSSRVLHSSLKEHNHLEYEHMVLANIMLRQM